MRAGMHESTGGLFKKIGQTCETCQHDASRVKLRIFRGRRIVVALSGSVMVHRRRRVLPTSAGV